MAYKVHTPETAPAKAREVLETAKKAYGFVPNLLGIMAESPALLKAYTTLGSLFSETSLSPTEQQVVLLSVSLENACIYCVSAHSVIAEMKEVPSKVIEALRNGVAIPDKKLEALRAFTVSVVRSRGWPSEEEVRSFLTAGYTQATILEVILGVGMKTLSNYTNHMAKTPLDAAFAKAAWSKVA